MRILVVEDDPHIADFVQQELEEAGYAVDHTADGEEGLRYALNQPYDAAVVDLMLLRRGGLIQSLQQRGVSTPVLILSAKRSVDERVEGLQAGGDDYLTKPFAFAELLARVQALIRRGSGTTELTRLTAGPLALDLLERTASRYGQPLRPGDRPAAARVFAARIPDAPPRPGHLQNHDSGARLGFRLHATDERGRGACTSCTWRPSTRRGRRTMSAPGAG